MSNPIMESLFFLKVARTYIKESIRNSGVKNKKELINYIQNEASDYEVMHLLTIGEMPKEKFNPVAEQQVWSIFKEAVVMNSASLRKSMLKEDLMCMVYEMGPVSEYGISSAAPILEFAMANGTLLEVSDPKNKNAASIGDAARRDWSNLKKSASDTATKIKGNVGKIYRKNTNQDGAMDPKDTTRAPKPNPNMDPKDSSQAGIDLKKAATYGGAAALGAAGLFGLYKLYKTWKEKKAAAKTPEAKKAAAAGIAKVQAKIKAAKKAKK